VYQERDHIAHVLQQGLLPQRLPEVPRLDITARYLPAGDGIEAGGDFYDVFPTGADRFGLVIGDVCGKGPEAAARMGIARPALRALAHSHRRPTKLLSALNDELLEHGGDFRFVTIAYVEAHVGQKPGARLTACLAGHPAGLLVTEAGSVREVGRPGTLLGIHREVSLHEHRVRMARGDTLLLYTDGLADDGPIAPAGADDLREILVAYRTAPPAELVRHLEGLLHRPDAADPRGRDDVAFMVVRCTG
jgi:serine phosphatase RsbU (regulator of sigma subunit)